MTSLINISCKIHETVSKKLKRYKGIQNLLSLKKFLSLFADKFYMSSVSSVFISIQVRLWASANQIGIIRFPVYKKIIWARTNRKLGIKYGEISLINSGLSFLTIWTFPPTPKPSISYPYSVYKILSFSLFSVFSGIFKF